MLPAELIIYGIEGADFGFGPGFSPPVERAITAAVDAITLDLAG